MERNKVSFAARHMHSRLLITKQAINNAACHYDQNIAISPDKSSFNNKSSSAQPLLPQSSNVLSCLKIWLLASLLLNKPFSLHVACRTREERRGRERRGLLFVAICFQATVLGLIET